MNPGSQNNLALKDMSCIFPLHWLLVAIPLAGLDPIQHKRV